MSNTKLNQDFGRVSAYRGELAFLILLGSVVGDTDCLIEKLLERAEFLKNESKKLLNENLNDELLTNLFKE